MCYKVFNCLFGGFLLLLGHIQTFINSGTIGNHAVNNNWNLFVFTAFIYSSVGSVSCLTWVKLLQHWALKKSNVLEKKKQKKQNTRRQTEKVLQRSRVEGEEERCRDGEFGGCCCCCLFIAGLNQTVMRRRVEKMRLGFALSVLKRTHKHTHIYTYKHKRAQCCGHVHNGGSVPASFLPPDGVINCIIRC